MGKSSDKRGSSKGKKVRVSFRRNRSARRRVSDWTQQARDSTDNEIDTDRGETIRGKGAISRRRTVTVHDDQGDSDDLTRGIVVAMRGLFAEVDDGTRVWPCTVRRVLLTRLIRERHPVTVGDRVRFRIGGEAVGVAQEGVIEAVEPRRGLLRRFAGRRIHTIVANVDQVVIVGSADQPVPKPHLIDRYIVAALAGDLTPIVCMNKSDLDREDIAKEILARYAAIGYATLFTSAMTGEGVPELRKTLEDQASVIAGQSGVGKSSLLNAVQPGLKLQTGEIIEQRNKGRHTTTTSTLVKLDVGGYVVDTPGIRTFDLATVDRDELEALFLEFIEHVANCKFPDCTHRHETNCAVKQAVEQGHIHPERYESYVRMYEEPTDPQWKTRMVE